MDILFLVSPCPPKNINQNWTDFKVKEQKNSIDLTYPTFPPLCYLFKKSLFAELHSFKKIKHSEMIQ